MKNLTSSVILFAVGIGSLSYGNILLKVGMDRYGALTGTGLTVGQALAKSPQLWVGIFVLSLQFWCTIGLFKGGWDASTVIPIMGLSYVAVAVLGKWMLGETVDATRWLGILLIVLGVFFVARSALPGKAG